MLLWEKKGFYRIPPSEWVVVSNPVVAEYRSVALANPSDTEFDLEEYVRQWVIRELVETYRYPSEWLGERISVEYPVQIGSVTYEADVTLRTERGRPFIYVETKNRGLSDAEYNKAKGQLESYLSATHTATVGMITDGTPSRTKVIRKKVDPNDFDLIPDLPTYDTSLKPKVRLTFEPPPPHSARRVGLTPIDNRYEDILFEAHSAIRDIDGLHADEALDELCKITYAKIFDERKITESPSGTPFRFQAYGGNVEEIASNIRDLYDEARNYDLTLYAQRIPGYERSRGVFKHPVRLSSAALYEVVSRLQNFSFLDSKPDVKGRAFQRVLAPAIRAGMGQYFTPDQIVRMAVAIIDPSPSDLILDPFCGSGHFLTSALDWVVDKYQGRVDEYTFNQFKFFHLHGIEKSDRMVRIAMTDMLLHEDGHSNIRNTDALLSFENYPDLVALGGDHNVDPAIFSIIMTNPPFGSILQEEARQAIGRFELGKGRKSLPLEILGLERCFQFLRPRGRLAIVLPDGILSNKRTRFVRDWYRFQARLKAVISLPPHTFSPFGSAVKASLVFFQKLRPDEVLSTMPAPRARRLTDFYNQPEGFVTEKNDSQSSKYDDYDVYLARIDDIGYEPSGRATAKSEIDEIIADARDKIRW